MKPPRLTLITITKDDPAGLARTIASAAAWRMAGAEQIVIDGSAAALAPAPPQEGGLTIYARPARGISDAFNAGLAAAQGEWIWFLNGGDQVDARLTPGFLFALLDGTRAQVLIGGTTYEGETEPRPHPPGELQWPLLRSWIPHPSTLVRRGLFAQFGGFDERYSIAMDYEWWLRVFSRSPSVAVDEVSVPFTLFAAGGVSQQPAHRDRVAHERDDAIRRHQRLHWRAWFFTGGRLARAGLKGLFARRLGPPPRQS